MLLYKAAHGLTHFGAKGIIFLPLALFRVAELSIRHLVNHGPNEEWETQLLTFGFADE